MSYVPCAMCAMSMCTCHVCYVLCSMCKTLRVMPLPKISVVVFLFSSRRSRTPIFCNSIVGIFRLYCHVFIHSFWFSYINVVPRSTETEDKESAQMNAVEVKEKMRPYKLEYDLFHRKV